MNIGLHWCELDVGKTYEFPRQAPFTFSSHYYVHLKYKIHNVGLSSLRNVHRVLV